MKTHYNIRVIVEETTTSEPSSSYKNESERRSTVTLIELKTQADSLASGVRKITRALDNEVEELELSKPQGVSSR